MSDWSHGYNVSTGYTFGFYREIAPDWIDFALAWRGQQPPRRDGEQTFRYLELGSGQGFGLCLLAAANPLGEFVGIDFSPEHTAHARQLARELGLTNIRFDEGDFATLGAAWPSDYGTFEYVALHGIYSWVPEAIRGSIVEILAAAVAPGGAVYVSYNALPGWLSTMPFQHILRLLETEGVAKGPAAIEAGRGLFEQMEGANAALFVALPGLKTRVAGTRKQPGAYLVQEYLHENWHPMWCSKVMGELSGAKLGLAGSATLAENLLPQVLPAAHQDVLKGKSEPKLREDLIDCLINQTFRRDLYVRGGRRRHAGEVTWRDTYRFWRVNPAPFPEEFKISTSFGTVMIKQESVAPLLDAIDDESRSLSELAALPAVRNDPLLLNQRLVLLLHAGWLGCSRRDPSRAGSAQAANAHLAALNVLGAPYRHLAAAKIGTGVSASDTDMLLLDSYIEDAAAFETSAATMLKQRLARLGRKLAKDGQPLQSADEAAEADRLAAEFRTELLPHWRKVGVID